MLIDSRRNWLETCVEKQPTSGSQGKSVVGSWVSRYHRGVPGAIKMGPKGFLGHMQNRWMLQLVGSPQSYAWMVHRVHLNLSDFGGSFSAGYLLDQNLGISSYFIICSFHLPYENWRI